MITDLRKKEILKAANQYSDTAININAKTASRKFFNDYINGVWTLQEHLILICLIHKYIDCKLNKITREQCICEQNKLFNDLG